MRQERQTLIDKQTQIILEVQEQIINYSAYVLSSSEVMQNAAETLKLFAETLNILEGDLTMALSQETFDALKVLITSRNENTVALANALAKVAELEQIDAENNTAYEATIADLRAQLEAALAGNNENNAQLAEIAELIRAEDEELSVSNPPVEPPAPVQPPAVEPTV